MSSQIKYDARLGESGLTLYAVIENTDGASASHGEFWNGSAWEAKAAANWANYAVATAEGSPANYQYVGTMPATGALAAAAIVTIHVYERAGAAPAIADRRLASQEFIWTGGALLNSAKAMEAVLAVVAGNSTFAESTGLAVYKKPDGSSTGVTYTVTNVGTRTSSTIA
jgi:hypothetical protein